jgi:glutamate synthase (NADPH/NADH) small chain
MELGAADASGRKRPVVIPGSEYLIDVDTVVVGVGTDPNPLIPQSVTGLEITKWGPSWSTRRPCRPPPEIFAGGDIVSRRRHRHPGHGDGKRPA